MVLRHFISLRFAHCKTILDMSLILLCPHKGFDALPRTLAQVPDLQ